MHDLTVVVGIDQKTARQLLVSWPTWRKYRPEMWRLPWVIFHDTEFPAGIKPDDVQTLIGVMGLDRSLVRVEGWPLPGSVSPRAYSGQREKMLSGFVHVPAAAVETGWWMKVDTDALALRESNWLEPSWFEADEDGRLNAWIASPWGYTKPAEQPGLLDAWGDTIAPLARHPRLNLPVDADGVRCRHPRMASWLSFYRTEWSVYAAGLAAMSCGAGMLPVPSQDGFHWYVAERRGDRVCRSKMKRRGWTNCSRIENLKQKAAEVLA